MKLGMQIGLGPGHIVLDGELPSPSADRRGTAPISAYVCCGQTAEWMKVPLRTEVGLGPGDFVLDGDPAHLPKRGRIPPPQFSAHVHCGQTVGWIKMALGTEVGLGPGYGVLDWDPASLPKKGAEPPSPISGPFLLCPNGWMHKDAAW